MTPPRWKKTPRRRRSTCLANDTDPEGDPITIESVVQPANGMVVITNGGADLTYQPDANYCNDPPGTTPDTFTYTINGGSDGDGVGHGHLCRRPTDRRGRRGDGHRG